MQFRFFRVVVCCLLIAVGITVTAGTVSHFLEKDSPATPASLGQREMPEVASSELSRKLSNNKVNAEAFDLVTLYANCRDAIATILIKDDLGFDAELGVRVRRRKPEKGSE